jgi:hypothetical protein
MEIRSKLPQTRLLVLVLFLGVFIGTSFSSSSSGNNCVTIPISLSNLTSCANGACLFTQQASLAIPATEGSQACIEFISPDGQSPPITLNVSLTHAHYNWLFDYSYFTDSVVIWKELSCDCSLTSSRDCSNCPASVPRGSIVQCDHGTSSSSGCVIPGAKNWCSRVGYEGYSRFKILHSNKVTNKDFGMIATINDNFWLIEYDGITQSYNNANHSIGLTVLTDTSTPTFTPEFVVFDQYDMSDFYLMDSGSVNSIDDFNPFKLGWFKAGEDIELSEQFTQENLAITVLDCGSNKFEVTSTFVDPTKLLANSVSKLASSVVPRSILEDRQWAPWTSGQYVPNHEVDSDVTLKQGFILSDANNNPIFIGLDKNNKIQPNAAPWNDITAIPRGALNYTTIVALSGNIIHFSSDSFSMVRTLPIYYDDVNDGLLHFLQLFHVVKAGQNEYFVCQGAMNNQSCNNFKFSAIGWPFLTTYNYTYEYGQFYQTPFGNNHNISDSMLVTHSNNGIINFLVTFTNLSIQFDTTPVSPVITSVTQDDVNIKVKAYSATVGGDCYFASQPAGVVITQPLTLSVTPQDYLFRINSPNVDGIVDFQIRCYSKQATARTKVVLNQVQNQSDINYISVDQSNSTDSSWGGLNIDFGGLDKALDDFFGTSWDWDKIFKILIYIAIGIVALLVIIYVIIPLLYTIMVRFSMTYKLTRFLPSIGRKDYWKTPQSKTNQLVLNRLSKNSKAN